MSKWIIFYVNTLVFYCQLVSASVTTDIVRPHIVFVLADDYGYNDVGYHGSDISTPTLDQLSADGIRLENYYVQPLCSPSRSVLMSGRYQIHTGLQHGSIQACQPNALPDDSPTLANKMKESGYATHMVGKWHLGFYKEKYLPWHRGFDTFYGYYTGAEDYFTHNRTYKEISYLELHAQDGPVWIERGHYSTNLFTEKAIDIVNNHNSSQPLFLYLAYQAVHGPLQGPDDPPHEKFLNIKDPDRQKYASMVSKMDEGVKNLTEALKGAGLWDSTVLVFSSDNGADVGIGGSNYPLRGGKNSYWEGGTRAVGFVSGGNVGSGGKISRDLIHISDWFPTFVRLAKGNVNKTKSLDGFDQWDTLIKDAPNKRNAILHNIDPLVPKKGLPLYNDTFDTSVTSAIRVGDMKLLTGDPGNSSWSPPLREFILMPRFVDSPSKNVWLFNISSDPSEHHDISEENPEIVRELLNHLRLYNSTSIPTRFPTNDTKCDPYFHLDVWGPWM